MGTLQRPSSNLFIIASCSLTETVFAVISTIIAFILLPSDCCRGIDISGHRFQCTARGGNLVVQASILGWHGLTPRSRLIPHIKFTATRLENQCRQRAHASRRFCEAVRKIGGGDGLYLHYHFLPLFARWKFSWYGSHHFVLCFHTAARSHLGKCFTRMCIIICNHELLVCSIICHR